ncbi:MAG: hypothetical protein KJZ64_06965 [Sphingomonadaceae bacterium]|nr:hypothetical protein [Sphingomonadaceae bacterium]
MSDPASPRDAAPYRQPMVTSLGIIMGFLLNFLAGWATEDSDGDTLMTTADYAVAIPLLLAIALMSLVLFRLLDARLPSEAAAAHYDTTFRLYCIAIVVAFAGVGIALFV